MLLRARQARASLRISAVALTLSSLAVQSSRARRALWGPSPDGRRGSGGPEPSRVRREDEQGAGGLASDSRQVQEGRHFLPVKFGSLVCPWVCPSDPGPAPCGPEPRQPSPQRGRLWSCRDLGSRGTQEDRGVFERQKSIDSTELCTFTFINKYTDTRSYNKCPRHSRQKESPETPGLRRPSTASLTCGSAAPAGQCHLLASLRCGPAFLTCWLSVYGRELGQISKSPS